MSTIPSGTELARPYMPTKDFDLSKRFYETLGFEKVLDGEVRQSGELRPLRTGDVRCDERVGKRQEARAGGQRFRISDVERFAVRLAATG